MCYFWILKKKGISVIFRKMSIFGLSAILDWVCTEILAIDFVFFWHKERTYIDAVLLDFLEFEFFEVLTFEL